MPKVHSVWEYGEVLIGGLLDILSLILTFVIKYLFYDFGIVRTDYGNRGVESNEIQNEPDQEVIPTVCLLAMCIEHNRDYWMYRLSITSYLYLENIILKAINKLGC